MSRPIILYGTALAAIAFLLEWLDYKHAVHAWSTEFYVTCIAVIFVALVTAALLRKSSFMPARAAAA